LGSYTNGDFYGMRSHDWVDVDDHHLEMGLFGIPGIWEDDSLPSTSPNLDMFYVQNNKFYIGDHHNTDYLMYFEVDYIIQVVVEPTIDEILTFFYDAIDAGIIEGVGNKPWIKAARLSRFQRMLERANRLYEKERYIVHIEKASLYLK